MRFKALFLLFFATFSLGFEIRSGDLILRKGIGTQSDFISYLGEFTYSHIGVVILTAPKIKIIHATTEDNKNRVIISDLDEFTSLSTKYAVMRFDLTQNEIDKFIKNLKTYHEKPFIIATKHEENLYCTTLIEKSLNGVKEYGFSYESVNLPIFRGEYLFPSAFTKHAKVIFESD